MGGMKWNALIGRRFINGWSQSYLITYGQVAMHTNLMTEPSPMLRRHGQKRQRLISNALN